MLDALFDVEAGEVDAVVDYGPAGSEQSGGGCEQRGLAGAVRADDGHDLTRLHRQRDAPDGFDLAIRDMQILDLEKRRHATLPR